MMTSRLLLDESPLLVIPTIARKVGVNEAIVLQQIHYWLNPEVNSNYFQGRHWVYNTYEQWQEQFSFWSLRTIRRIINTLEEQGMLTSFAKLNFKKTKYYTINYERLHAIGIGFKQITEVSESSSSQDIISQQSAECSQVDHIEVVNLTNTPDQNEHMGNQSNANQHNGFSKTDNLDRPSGQSDHINLANLDSTSGQSGHIDLANLDSTSGQPDHIDLANLDRPSGQLGHIDLAKLATSYKDTKISSKITIPPLTPPPSKSKNEKKLENKKISTKPENIRLSEENHPITPETSSNFSVRSQEEEEEEFKNLINFWNEEIQSKLKHQEPQIFLSTARRERLAKLMREVFDDDSAQWSSYCQQISNSKLLMGEGPDGFKLTLDWALQPENALAVLDGAASSGQSDQRGLDNLSRGSGQSDQGGLDNLTRGSGQSDHIDLANLDSTSGQPDHIDLANLDRPSGQLGHIDLAKLATSYKDTKISSKITIPPPPLTPPPSKSKNEKKLENKKISTKPESIRLSEENHLATLETSSNFSVRSQEKEEEEFKNLINFWNEEVQSKLKHQEPQIFLSTTRRERLAKLMREVFDNDSAQWSSYCQQISNSKLLMGEDPEGFKLTLDWALQPENALAVLDGAASSGQSDQRGLDNLTRGSGQSDQGGLDNLTRGSGQSVQRGLDNLTRPYTENTSEIPPPPLTPPPSKSKNKKKIENKQISIKPENIRLSDENHLVTLETSSKSSVRSQEEEEEEFKNLINFWNEEVQSNLNQQEPEVFLTTARRERLAKLMREVFDDDSTQWSSYCQQISNNKPLMGEGPDGFKLTLDWALQPENALEVLDGAASSGQFDQRGLDNLSRGSGQSDQGGLDNLTRGSGQSVQRGQDNLTRPYTENTSEIPPPPLTPPPSKSKNEKKLENKKISTKPENIRLSEENHLATLETSSNFSVRSQEEEEEEEFKNLINFWNEKVQSNLNQQEPEVFLTTARRERLAKLMREVFDDDSAQWSSYCQQISNSKLLMGEDPEGFKLTLDWALQPENALAVLDGAASSGQSDLGGLDNLTRGSGQSDQGGLDNLTRPYTENTSEIPPPPLTPPPSKSKNEKKLENKKISTKPKNLRLSEENHLATLETSSNFSVRSQEEEEEEFKNLINFWNEEVQSKLNQQEPEVFLTTARRERLAKLMREVFDDDSTQWSSYCQQISNSKLLMGEDPEGFKLTLDWALQPENALAVLDGAASSGQFDQRGLDNLSRGSGQSDQGGLDNLTRGSGQSDQGGLDNLTRPYTENTSEIPPPPLTPPPSKSKNEKKLENKKIPTKPENIRLSEENHPITPETPSKLSVRSQEEEEEEFKNLINFWNEEVQSKINPQKPEVFLTKAHREQLPQLMQEVFQNDSSQWRSYCQQIGNCKFLLGGSSSGFKVSLNWALQPKNAHKVLEGVIYDKPKTSETNATKKTILSWSEFDEKITQHCLKNQYSKPWPAICKQLARRVSRPTFNSWFLDVKPLVISESQVVLQAITPFRQQYINSNFTHHLVEALQPFFPKIKEQNIKITVVPDHPFVSLDN